MTARYGWSSRSTPNSVCLDRVKALAPEHPEWKDQQPFKAVLEGDMKTVAASGEKGIAELVMATHAGMSPAEFQKIVGDWLAEAKDKRFGRSYTDLVYQPMLELLSYLRANGFTTYIVSGGGIEFVRNFSEPVYGIPPAQVVGSSIKTKYELVDGKPTLIRLPELDFINDKDGKPVGINQYIGQRPIAAFGNSDGDYQMLDWTTAGEGPRFGLIVHHTDAEREYAYDRDSSVGRLDQALDDAPAKGWVVVDMKNDWKEMFPPENSGEVFLEEEEEPNELVETWRRDAGRRASGLRWRCPRPGYGRADRHVEGEKAQHSLHHG